MTSEEKQEIIDKLSQSDFDDESKSLWAEFIRKLPPDYREIDICKHRRLADSMKVAAIYKTRLGFDNKSEFSYLGYENTISRLQKYALPVLLISFHYAETHAVCFCAEEGSIVIGFLYVEPVLNPA